MLIGTIIPSEAAMRSELVVRISLSLVETGGGMNRVVSLLEI